MSTRNTWCDAVGTLLAIFVSLIVGVTLIFGLVASRVDFWRQAPPPALAVPDAAKGLEPPPTDLAVGRHHRASVPVEPLTLEAPAEDSLQVDIRPSGIDVPIPLVSP